MAGVGPLDLAGTVQAVAHILDGQPVEVIGLDGRKTYPHESVSAVVTVSVHLDGSTKADLAIAAAINAMVEAETSADTKPDEAKKSSQDDDEDGDGALDDVG